MFADIAQLLAVQEPLLANIENHVTNAVVYTESGVKQLSQAAAKQDTARSITCWIVFILLLAVGITLSVLFGVKVL